MSARDDYPEAAGCTLSAYVRQHEAMCNEIDSLRNDCDTWEAAVQRLSTHLDNLQQLQEMRDLMPSFADDPVAMRLGLTPAKPGVLLPGTPQHCHRCALDELERYDGLRPACPTCDGTRNLHPEKSMFNFCDPCPDCTDGRMPWERMAAIVARVFKFPAEERKLEDDHGSGWCAAIDHLRSVRP